MKEGRLQQTGPAAMRAACRPGVAQPHGKGAVAHWGVRPSAQRGNRPAQADAATTLSDEAPEFSLNQLTVQTYYLFESHILQ